MENPPPVFSIPNATLYHGDALELLAQLPPESVQLIYADPPYGLSNDGSTCHAGKRVSVNKGSWDRSRGFSGELAFHQAWLRACQRVLAPQGTLWISGSYHSIYACGFVLQQDGWHLLNEICWYKPNAAPNLACRMFAHSHETLLWAKKTRPAKHTFHYQALRQGRWEEDVFKREGKQMRSVWTINTPRPGEKTHGKHPTQKPLALLERIVLAASNPGDLVLDPFCGSATSGVAALQLGRCFIGIDAELEYLEQLAKPRLLDVASQQDALPSLLEGFK